jgi:hypothetical protein
MTDTAAELEALRALCPEAEIWMEGGHPLAHLPGLKYFLGGQPRQDDALLCPRARDGYATRLFFKEIPQGTSAKWTAHNICGKTWYTRSWKDISADLPWIEIVSNHLRGLV